MPQPDPLNISHGHLAVAARTALDLHRAIELAYRSSSDSSRRHQLALATLTHMNTMRQLALALDDLPEFFKGNLAPSLRMAADQPPTE